MVEGVTLEGLNCALNIFLKLKINPTFIAKIFTEAGYERKAVSPGFDLGIPGIETSPTGVEPAPIFKVSNNLVAYSPEATAIHIAGQVSGTSVVLLNVIQTLEKNGVDVEASIRYLEFQMGYSPEVPKCVNSLRADLSYDKLKSFKEVFDEDMKFYGIILGNSDSALFDNWTRIKLEPDLFRPNYGNFEIVKRSTSVANMETFLSTMDKRLNKLVEILKT